MRRLVRVLPLILLLGLTPALPALAQEVLGESSEVTSIDAAAWVNVPAAVSFPTLAESAPIVPLGMEEDGAMAAPADPDTVGWWMFGPGVGVAGNTVLAGHVDWGGRLRAFGRVYELQPGDEVDLMDANGSWLAYSVEWSRLVDADTDPTDTFAQSDREELTLITCGGVFDPVTREYLSRLIVRAVRI